MKHGVTGDCPFVWFDYARLAVLLVGWFYCCRVDCCSRSWLFGSIDWTRSRYRSFLLDLTTVKDGTVISKFSFEVEEIQRGTRPGKRKRLEQRSTCPKGDIKSRVDCGQCRSDWSSVGDSKCTMHGDRCSDPCLVKYNWPTGWEDLRFRFVPVPNGSTSFDK